jgi:phenylpyruvate tautomerase PptA (4-oxalocrotonate tautomerase family)
MPIIEVKAFERRLEDPEAAERVIAGLTDALCEALGEEVRAETWVLLEGVAPSRWGFAGEVRK